MFCKGCKFIEKNVYKCIRKNETKYYLCQWCYGKKENKKYVYYGKRIMIEEEPEKFLKKHKNIKFYLSKECPNYIDNLMIENIYEWK